MLSQLFCLCFLWPALVLRFGLFATQPRQLAAPRVRGRQWGLVQHVAGRYVAVRVQLVIVRGAAC